MHILHMLIAYSMVNFLYIYVTKGLWTFYIAKCPLKWYRISALAGAAHINVKLHFFLERAGLRSRKAEQIYQNRTGCGLRSRQAERIYQNRTGCNSPCDSDKSVQPTRSKKTKLSSTWWSHVFTSVDLELWRMTLTLAQVTNPINYHMQIKFQRP